MPSTEAVQHVSKAAQPLIYLIPTAIGSLALIVMEDDIHSVWLDDLIETAMIEQLNNVWFAAQNNHQARLAAIDLVTEQLWNTLMGPLVTHLRRMDVTRAILISTGFLGFLPLHAAWIEDSILPSGRRYAFDDVHFTYAPNAKSIAVARPIADGFSGDKLLAIANPTQDLPGSSREVMVIARHFSDCDLLSQAEATVAEVSARLSGNAIAHFSCHGTSDFAHPLNSGLVLSDGILTLKDILSMNLSGDSGLRLVVLSACETGMQGFENIDEAISLPTGLIQAGVAAVISSLWPVSDFSTMILLARFYDFWKIENVEISQALRQSQQWLRDTTNSQKYDYLKEGFSQLVCAQQMPSQEMDEMLREFMLQYIYVDGLQARSFAHPFYWAAFVCTGI